MAARSRGSHFYIKQTQLQTANSKMPDNLLYQIALTLIPNIGPVQARILVEHFGDAESIFKASRKELIVIENIVEVRAHYIKPFKIYSEAKEAIDLEKSIKFKHFL